MYWSFPLRLLACTLLLGLGLGAVPARGADYPLPERCQGQVDTTHVKAGGCVLFTGGDFKPGTDITITDNGRVVAHTTADSHGNFSQQICFGTDAALGRHVLVAHGDGADGAACDATATVTVEGASTTRPPPGDGNGDGNGDGDGDADGNGDGNGDADGNGSGDGNGDGNGGAIPFTGQQTLLLLSVGLLLLLLGTLATRQGRSRRAGS